MTGEPQCTALVPAGRMGFSSVISQGEIGPDLFRQASEFGLEGLVSKQRDRPYCGGFHPGPSAQVLKWSSTNTRMAEERLLF